MREMRRSELTHWALMGFLMILSGISLILFLLPQVLSQEGVKYILLLGGVPIFSGVAILLGMLIHKADKWARIRETGMSDNPSKDKEIHEGPGEGREQIGTCIVCKEKLFLGDPIASCPSCGGIAHRGDFLEWLHIKGTCPACRESLQDGQVQATDAETRSRKHE